MSKQTDEDLIEITKKIQHIGGLVESASTSRCPRCSSATPCARAK